jgi:hypothetical protein
MRARTLLLVRRDASLETFFEKNEKKQLEIAHETMIHCLSKLQQLSTIE